MPIIITPATAVTSAPVILSNTLGYPVTYRITVATCSGRAVSQTAAQTLPSGREATEPKGTDHRLVTFTVARAQTSDGLQTQIQLTSRQGCSAAPKPATVRPQPVETARAHTGVAVVPASSSNLPDIIGGAAIGFAVVAAAALAITRRARKPRGAHRS